MRGRSTAGIAAGLAAALALAGGAHAAGVRAGRVYLGTGERALAVGAPGAPGGLGAPAGSTIGDITGSIPGWTFTAVDNEDLPAGAYAGPRPWAVRASARAIDGTVHQSARPGSTATVPVQGARATIYYVAMRGGAVADVYLDAYDPADPAANRVGTMRQSRAYRRKAWALHLAGLPTDPGRQLVIRQRTRGRMNLDAVVFQDEAVETPVTGLADFTLDPADPDDAYPYWSPADPYLTLEGLWSTWPGRTSWSWRKGGRASFAFTGDAFGLYLYLNRRRLTLGRLKVVIDPGLPTEFVTVISQRRGRRGYWWYWWDALPPGPHTVTLIHRRGVSVNLRGFWAFDLSLP